MIEADTIFARASAPGAAAIALVRISGPHAIAALTALTNKPAPSARIATLCTLIDPACQRVLDRALVLVFQAPHSYTGEDMVELHLHGGHAVVASVLDALGNCAGLRMAQPGEFTRHALMNGKLDLAQAEGIHDLIQAETSAQQAQALALAGGELSRRIAEWREALMQIAAHIAAAIDFADQDLGDGLLAEAQRQIPAIMEQMQTMLDNARAGELIRRGASVAIIGAPNVGKSALFNHLASHPLAIVSDQAGTTRDVVECRLQVQGLAVGLADTAGLHEHSDNAIEVEGMRRARIQAERADFCIVVGAVTDPESIRIASELCAEGDLLVTNKIDCTDDRASDGAEGVAEGVIAVSAVTGEGIEALRERIESRLQQLVPKCYQLQISRARHVDAISEAFDHLGQASEQVMAELLSEELNLALRALDRLVGVHDVEELLDQIFRDFCIGK